MINRISQAYLPNSGQAYARRYSDIRIQSIKLAEHLSPEDQQVQSIQKRALRSGTLATPPGFLKHLSYCPTCQIMNSSTIVSISYLIPIMRLWDHVKYVLSED